MKKMTFSEKQQTISAYTACGLLLCLLAFLCFYRLGAKYVDPWDEARHGVNAYEMLREGNLFQNTYLYEPDYYNLKPPLSMWCQMLSFLIMGANPFSLRFYSGLCYMLLAIVCGRFAWKRYGRLAAVLTIALFSANTTPFAAHMVRAGDADSLYVLFFTLAMLFMIQIPKKQSKLFLCGIFFALAFLTKSYHAGVIALIGGLYLILTGEIKRIKLKTWLLFLASCAVPVLIWAVPRFLVDKTVFFREMLLTDVLGRTDGTLQNNVQPFGWYAEYYLGVMSGKLTIYLWALVVIVAAVFLFTLGKKKEELLPYKNEAIAYALWILVPFLAFSAVSNKLLWYLYPVTIPLLLCAAALLSRLLLEKRLFALLRLAAAFLVCICIFVYARDVYGTIRNQTKEAGNEFQNLIRDTAGKLKKEEGEHVKIAASVVYSQEENGKINSDWAGQDVFVAESEGDIRCKQGGLRWMAQEILQPSDVDVRLIFFAKDCEYLLLVQSTAPPDGLEKYGETENYVVYRWY